MTRLVLPITRPPPPPPFHGLILFLRLTPVQPAVITRSTTFLDLDGRLATERFTIIR